MSQHRPSCPPSSFALAPRLARALTPSTVHAASQSLPARWLVPIVPVFSHPELSRLDARERSIHQVGAHFSLQRVIAPVPHMFQDQ